MLKIKTTSITLKGTATVEVEGNAVPVITMVATISEIGHSSETYTVINQPLYDANKETVRSDKDAFTAKVREIEDAGIETVTGVETETEVESV